MSETAILRADIDRLRITRERLVAEISEREYRIRQIDETISHFLWKISKSSPIE